jgi:hypothetical protein
MPNLPSFSDWPDDQPQLLPWQIHELYEQGHRGTIDDPEESQRLTNCLSYKTWVDAADEFGTAGAGAGKLSRPWQCVARHEPEAFPGPPQTRGDCVSRATANACTVTMFAEIEAGEPDEVSHLVESYDPVAEPSQGVISSEVIYGARGHRGEGANCDRLARFVSVDGGVMLRRVHDIDGYGVLDLTRYDADIGFHMGPEVPRAICDYAGEHRIRDCTRIKTIEDARDALACGYGLSICSAYGFKSRRDKFGVAGRRGSWLHSMAIIGVNDDPDDPACIAHGRPLLCILNSWGSGWQAGPRYNDQPPGSFWITPRTGRGMIGSGSCFAFSSLDGFPRKELPDYGATGIV